MSRQGMQEINTFCILMSEPPNQISLRNQYKYINNPHICCVSMDDLLNIFARLPDSTDLANCCLTSCRLLSLSYHVSSISLQQHRQYNPIPFKTRVVNLVSLLCSPCPSNPFPFLPGQMIMRCCMRETLEIMKLMESMILLILISSLHGFLWLAGN